jgi:hypothetical protein
MHADYSRVHMLACRILFIDCAWGVLVTLGSGGDDAAAASIDCARKEPEPCTAAARQSPPHCTIVQSALLKIKTCYATTIFTRPTNNDDE